MAHKLIGVVGGVGPYAGLELCRKMMDLTIAQKDQDHLPVALLSVPEQIEDRSAFLLGRSRINPGLAIAKIITKLASLGAEVVGIPCNASHAPAIHNVIREELRRVNCNVKLVHMIDEVAEFIRERSPGVKKVGVLSVTGTYQSGIYQNILTAKGFEVIAPPEELQHQFIHPAIYDLEYGIKAHSNPITDEARRCLLEGIHFLESRQAEAAVLGCTEMSLAIMEEFIGNLKIIDSTLVLARALIRESGPERLQY